MRYHYISKNSIRKFGKRFEHDGSFFKSATLYAIRGMGLLVVIKRFDKVSKDYYYEELPPDVANDIYINENFKEYFIQHADYPDRYGLYPVVNVRKLMWALRMKPLEKEWWEKLEN